MAPSLNFLRPYASQSVTTAPSPSGSAYMRFYKLSRLHPRILCQRHNSTVSPAIISRSGTISLSLNRDVESYNPEDRSALMAFRIKELKKAEALSYPRLKRYGKPLTISNFRKEYEDKIKQPSESFGDVVTVGGRVASISRLGSKLAFVKLVMDGSMVQGVININKLVDGTEVRQFTELTRLVQRGDHISITGLPMRTQTSELSVEAIHLPQILAPSLAPLPQRMPEEARMPQRHIDLLINKQAAEILRVRSCVLRHLRQWMETKLQCIEVHTPILAANAGGAVARPFLTRATEFPGKQLALRIAPELWLKRLVVSGFDRIYEIGPAFRNEGIDSTHNPEFTICEFYVSHYNLEQVMQETKDMLHGLATAVAKFKDDHNLDTFAPPEAKVFARDWIVIDFIPAINLALGRPLPVLENNPNTVQQIIKILEERGKDWHKSLPPNPSLSKLLDHIAAAVLEPQSKDRPIFIIKHPVCMSPLAKSFTCPITNQLVSARAEVFFDGNELANMYEEENSPFAQRRKFVEQAKAKLAQQQAAEGEESFGHEDDEPAHEIDEQYISVLESGLPPTAGWGCGVDRLVMMFTRAKRISNVLPFGNLRNVVGLASTGPQHQEAKKDDDEKTNPDSTSPEVAGTAGTLPLSREEVENAVEGCEETVVSTGNATGDEGGGNRPGPSFVIEPQSKSDEPSSDDSSAAQAESVARTADATVATQETDAASNLRSSQAEVPDKGDHKRHAADEALRYVMGDTS